MATMLPSDRVTIAGTVTSVPLSLTPLTHVNTARCRQG